jgi:hypothetical protein
MGIPSPTVEPSITVVIFQCWRLIANQSIGNQSILVLSLNVFPGWATKKHLRGFFHLCDVSDQLYAIILPFQRVILT